MGNVPPNAKPAKIQLSDWHCGVRAGPDLAPEAGQPIEVKGKQYSAVGGEWVRSYSVTGKTPKPFPVVRGWQVVEVVQFVSREPLAPDHGFYMKSPDGSVYYRSRTELLDRLRHRWDLHGAETDLIDGPDFVLFRKKVDT